MADSDTGISEQGLAGACGSARFKSSEVDMAESKEHISDVGQEDRASGRRFQLLHCGRSRLPIKLEDMAQTVPRREDRHLTTIGKPILRARQTLWRNYRKDVPAQTVSTVWVRRIGGHTNSRSRKIFPNRDTVPVFQGTTLTKSIGRQAIHHLGTGYPRSRVGNCR